MCGILCCLYKSINGNAADVKISAILTAVSQYLSNRGPDLRGSKTVSLQDKWNCNFCSHILWMQGQEATEQPIKSPEGNILLWNGDIFDITNKDRLESDTTLLFNALNQASLSDFPETQILQVVSSIRGPWSLVFWDNLHQSLWFGRDAMGRHSLLWSPLQDSSPGLLLTSAATRQHLPRCRELPAAGVFVARPAEQLDISLYPWSCVDMEELTVIYPSEDFPPNLHICDTPHLLSPYPVPNMNTPQEDDEFILLLNNLTLQLTPEEVFKYLLQNQNVEQRVDLFFQALKNAVDIRVKTQPNLCQLCVPKVLESSGLKTICDHSKVALLFSGGLDSAVLAAIADKCVAPHESIDLINVAFQMEKPPQTQQKCRKERRRQDSLELTQEICHNELPLTDTSFNVPDRITGKNTYRELVKLSPQRKWNFVEVNVSKCELLEQRQARIADLIHPRCSVLDDSLGCAVWFAARGRGTLHQSGLPAREGYSSPARVLLLGMGADELLGGYSRCRKLFSRTQDWSQIAQSLRHDFLALPTRNLGRDDRVTCDSGRQARFPYLSEEVVCFLSSLPSHQRTAPLPSLPPGVGEKVLLRLLACRLGLVDAAAAPKRALQFGSRVAGLEARNEKGDAPCSRLLLPSPSA